MASRSRSGSASYFALIAACVLHGCGGGSEAAPRVEPAAPAAAPAKPSAAQARIAKALATLEARKGTAPAAADARLAGIGDLLNRGRYDEARARLDPIVAADPAADQARLYLALAHHKAKHYAEARPHFERVLDGALAFPKAEGTLHFYGWCLYWLGELADGLAAFEAFLKLRADDHDSWFGAGVCRLESGDLDGAQRDLERAIALAEAARAPREQSKAWARLGDVALARDDPAKARAHLEFAVRLYPDHFEAWHKLSRVCARLGDEAAAQRARLEFERRRRE